MCSNHLLGLKIRCSHSYKYYCYKQMSWQQWLTGLQFCTFMPRDCVKLPRGCLLFLEA